MQPYPQRYACCWLKLSCNGCELHMRRNHTHPSLHTTGNIPAASYSAWPPCMLLVHVLLHCQSWPLTYHLVGGDGSHQHQAVQAGCANDSRPALRAIKTARHVQLQPFRGSLRKCTVATNCTEYWSSRCCGLLTAPAWFRSQPCPAFCVSNNLFAWLWDPCGKTTTSTCIDTEHS